MVYICIYWIRSYEPREFVRVYVFVSVTRQIPAKNARYVYLIRIWWCSELFTYVYVYWIEFRNSSSQIGNASLFTKVLFTIFVPLDPPPSQPAKWWISSWIAITRTSNRIANISQNWEQTLQILRTNRIMNKRVLTKENNAHIFFLFGWQRGLGSSEQRNIKNKGLASATLGNRVSSPAQTWLLVQAPSCLTIMCQCREGAGGDMPSWTWQGLPARRDIPS